MALSRIAPIIRGGGRDGGVTRAKKLLVTMPINTGTATQDGT